MPSKQFSWMGPSKTTSEVLETALMRETSETAGLVSKRVVPKSGKEKRAAILAEARRVLRTLNSDAESEVEENDVGKFDEAPFGSSVNVTATPAASSGPPPPAAQGGASMGNQSLAEKWKAIRSKLPIAKGQKDQRDKLFKQFDPNGNGFLSLAEVDKGAREILSLHTLTNGLAPILLRAHTKAKNAATQHGDVSVDNADYVQSFEFRALLVYIYKYFELWSIFDAIDADKDRRISYDEFLKAVPILEGWGMKIEDASATFASVDANGGGQVLFNEFCDWAFDADEDVV